MGSIRFLLASAVVFYHSYHFLGLKMTGGTVSVQAFYMISGFYMALILNEKYTAGPGSWKLFISNRLLRLYPIYFIVLALVLLFSATGIIYDKAYFSVWYSKGPSLHFSTWLYFIITHITVIGQDLASFLFIDPGSGILHFTSDFLLAPKPYATNFFMLPQSWTMSVEISFYLVAPFLVRRKWFVQAGIVVLSLIARYYCYNAYHFNFTPWTYRFFPFEIGMFLLGSLAYLVWKNYVSQRKFTREIHAGLWCAVVVCIFIFDNIKIDELYKAIIFYLLLFAGLPFIFELTKNSRIDRWVGELSYPIYIVHHMCLMIIKPFIWDGFKYLNWFGVFSLLLSIAFAILLNRFVAEPVERFRQRRVAQRKLLQVA